MTPKAKPPLSRPALRLVETTPCDDAPVEPKWSGRRRVVVMIGLGVLMWALVAGGGWLLAQAVS